MCDQMAYTEEMNGLATIGTGKTFDMFGNGTTLDGKITHAAYQNCMEPEL